MSRQGQLPSADSQVVVDARGDGEWIVSLPAGSQALHIYELAPGDWLVSEVGRGSEGRGKDLEQALAALSAGGSAPHWWSLVAEALSVAR